MLKEYLNIYFCFPHGQQSKVSFGFYQNLFPHTKGPMSSTASWFCPPFLMRMTGVVPWQVDGTHPLESKIYSPHCLLEKKKSTVAKQV